MDELDRIAALEAHHWWYVGRRSCVAAVLDARLPRRREPRRILDVGSGLGGMFPLLRRYGAVEGAEAQEPARTRAGQLHPDVPVHACRLPDLLPPGWFDVVTAFDVLQTLDEPVLALTAMRARLARDGLVVLTVSALPALWGPNDEARGHRRRYMPAVLAQQLHQAGFTVVAMSFFNTLLLPAVAGVKLVQRLTGRAVPGGGLPGAVNGALGFLFGAEGHLLRGRELPVGASLYAVATPRIQ